MYHSVATSVFTKASPMSPTSLCFHVELSLLEKVNDMIAKLVVLSLVRFGLAVKVPAKAPSTVQEHTQSIWTWDAENILSIEQPHTKSTHINTPTHHTQAANHIEHIQTGVC